MPLDYEYGYTIEPPRPLTPEESRWQQMYQQFLENGIDTSKYEPGDISRYAPPPWERPAQNLGPITPTPIEEEPPGGTVGPHIPPGDNEYDDGTGDPIDGGRPPNTSGGTVPGDAGGGSAVGPGAAVDARDANRGGTNQPGSSRVGGEGRGDWNPTPGGSTDIPDGIGNTWDRASYTFIDHMSDATLSKLIGIADEYGGDTIWQKLTNPKWLAKTLLGWFVPGSGVAEAVMTSVLKNGANMRSVLRLQQEVTREHFRDPETGEVDEQAYLDFKQAKPVTILNAILGRIAATLDPTASDENNTQIPYRPGSGGGPGGSTGGGNSRAPSTGGVGGTGSGGGLPPARTGTVTSEEWGRPTPGSYQDRTWVLQAVNSGANPMDYRPSYMHPLRWLTFLGLSSEYDLNGVRIGG